MDNSRSNHQLRRTNLLITPRCNRSAHQLAHQSSRRFSPASHQPYVEVGYEYKCVQAAGLQKVSKPLHTEDGASEAGAISILSHRLRCLAFKSSSVGESLQRNPSGG